MARELIAPGLGSFHKWDKIGSKLVGRYVGQGVSKFGAVIIIEDGDLQKKASMPGDLGDWMSQVQVGEYVEITFIEAVPSKQPQPFKKFVVKLIDEMGPAISGASAPLTVAKIVAAKKVLETVTEAEPETEYDRLLAMLKKANPKGAAAIKGALESFPEGERIEKLKGVLEQQGVKVGG